MIILYQVLGTIIRERFPDSRVLTGQSSRNSFSHVIAVVVSVMPCADKKLEASRLDFFDESLSLPEVDLVLTTTDLLSLLESTDLSSRVDEIGSAESLGDVQQFLTPDFASPHVVYNGRCVNCPCLIFMVASQILCPRINCVRSPLVQSHNSCLCRRRTRCSRSRLTTPGSQHTEIVTS